MDVNDPQLLPGAPMQSSWIGVDLDGTLAYYDHWRGIEHIGTPIWPMVQRVHRWLAEGKQVRVFTARAEVPECIPFIESWLLRAGLPLLPITNIKDFAMVEFWDDRAKQVIPNTGNALDGTW